MNRALKEFFKGKLLRTVFRHGQRLGIDILPRHFYSEIPDLRRLFTSGTWKMPYHPAINGWDDLETQLAFTADVLGKCEENVAEIHKSGCALAGEQGFGVVEAAALRSFVMTRRPPTVLQVGCGASTALVIQAAEKTGYQPRIVCVEPYPSPFLRKCESEGR